MAAEPLPSCTVPDPELAELSGLAVDDRVLYAIADGGTSLRVAVLDPATCATVDEITAPTDPYDVEDLALGRDGDLWLADTGDNDARRDTVALHRLRRDGTSSLYRLVYPDGPRDTETLLLDAAGVPYVISKVISGRAEVFRPTGPLAEPGPTALQRVGEVRIVRTDTPGGPVEGIGSLLITGGAVSADGTVVAVRTYTDVYLYAAPDGDIAAALTGVPVRVPLPDEAQGEAVAFGPDGTLWSGSEAGPGRGASIRAIPGAVGLVTG